MGPFEQINNRLIPQTIDAAVGGQIAFVDERLGQGQIAASQLDDARVDRKTAVIRPTSITEPSKSWVRLTLASLSTVVGLVLVGILFWRRS